jgi:WXG100 family type VII secretion target
MSTDASFYVNYSGVGDVLDMLENADQRIQTLITNLQQDIKPLEATWSGTSEDEYQKVQAKWTVHMATMQGILSGPVRNTLNEMQINYAQTDNGLAAQWQAIP